MSTAKKIISILLCFVIAFGSFSVAGFAASEAVTENSTTTIDGTTYHTGSDSVVKSITEIESSGYAPDENGEYSDWYLYFGIDFYEQNEHGKWELTDHYVQPGQTLRAYFYLKSNMWCSAGNPYLIFERSMFDVTNGFSELTYDETYDPEHKDYPTENYPGNLDGTNINLNHADIAANGNYYKYTTKWARNIPGFTELALTNFHDVPLEESDTWDFWYFIYGRDATSLDAYRFDEDEHFLTFDVKVREYQADGVTPIEEGSTAFVKTDKRLYQIYDNQDGTGDAASKRVCNISTRTDKGPYGTAKRMNVQTDYDINDFLVEDCNHLFTIGEPPVEEPEDTVKYTATFIENDGTVISSKQGIEGSGVNVPDAVENQIGWANAETGLVNNAVKSGSYIRLYGDITYKRVLSTDRFPLTLDFNEGTLNGETSKTVYVPYGQETDLSEYLPNKIGYSATFAKNNKYTLTNILGETIKASWTVKQYKASFYTNKNDSEPYKVINARYGNNVACPKPTKEGYIFTGWYETDTDKLISTQSLLGKYNYDKDMSFYAGWTESPDSITFMIKNFTTGEWTPYIVKHGDGKGVYGTATKDFTISEMNNIKKSLTSEDFGWDGDYLFIASEKFTSMTFSSEYNSTDNIKNPISYDGHKIVYIHAKPIYDIELKIPVYDTDTGKYTGEYTIVNKQESSTALNHIISKSSLEINSNYVFDTIVDQTGSVADFYDSGRNYIVNLASYNTSKISLTIKVKPVEYEIRFLVGSSDGAYFCPTKTVNMGTVINGSTDEFKSMTGTNKDEIVYLPVEGVLAEDQKTYIYSKVGYKFVGWQLNSSDEFIDIENFEITPEIAAKAFVASNGNNVIQVVGCWEAQPYDVKFYYWAPGSSLENPVYTEDPIVVSALINTSKDAVIESLSEADIAKIKASIPEGYKDSVSWADENGSLAGNNVTAGENKYYAVYSKTAFTVYVDTNKSDTEKDIQRVNGLLPVYGNDITVPIDEKGSIEDYIFRYNLGTLEKPSEYHEVVDWKVYHIHSPEDKNDPSKWHEGVNDEGTNIIKSDIIYQAVYKEHKDFFFILYNINGEITKALGKDFKWHYWHYGRISDKETAVLNPDPDMVILFFKPSFVNSTIVFEPFHLPKDLFTIGNFINFSKMIITLIGNLIKG